MTNYCCAIVSHFHAGQERIKNKEFAPLQSCPLWSARNSQSSKSPTVGCHPLVGKSPFVLFVLVQQCLLVKQRNFAKVSLFVGIACSSQFCARQNQNVPTSGSFLVSPRTFRNEDRLHATSRYIFDCQHVDKLSACSKRSILAFFFLNVVVIDLKASNLCFGPQLFWALQKTGNFGGL